jgi:hypothetical protein
MRQGFQGKRTDPDIRDRIADLAAQGATAKRIADILSADEEVADRVPGERTIRAIASRYRGADPSGPWSVATADPSDVPHVLPVIADMLEAEVPAKFRFSWLTVREARHVATMRRYAPDLPSVSAFLLARSLVVAEDSQEPTRDIDEFLAFAPWRDAGDRYVKAFNAERIDRVRFVHGVDMSLIGRIQFRHESKEDER